MERRDGRGNRLKFNDRLKIYDPRWVNELYGKHTGETAFLLGNGWSLNYYDPELMRKDGVILGCNKAFTQYNVDYLFFQDTNILKTCAKFPGTKIFWSNRLDDCLELLDPQVMATSYVYSKGRKGHNRPNDERLVGYKSTGAHAMQIAIFMGFSKIVMVGCDCRVWDKPDGKECYTANVFHDKVESARIVKKRSPIEKLPGGDLTSSLLNGFAKHMTMIYDTYKDRTTIEMAGPWGISTFRIPNREFPEYWSDKHPGMKGINNDSGGS